MKNFKIGLIAILAIIMAISCSKDKPVSRLVDDVSSVSRAAVDPVLFPDWQSGDAAYECNQAGDCQGFSYKIDPPENGVYTHAGNTITITDYDGYSFSWTSEREVCAVIVKGGPVANVYYYPDGSCGDSGLFAPTNPNNGQPYEISHMTFCWSETLCDQEPGECYEDETAWAQGARYVKKGNWAMYVAYSGVEKTVNLIAGQNMVAGTVTFSAPSDGMIDITIDLNDDFIFYYDVFDPYQDDNVKIQDYATKPSGNPAPGLFAWKAFADVNTDVYTISVPANNYYGVHVDVGHEVPCE